ncbi:MULTISPECIES: phosphate ABC transporter permease PstA [unclassified Luteococcus]|uniref:phosphate ABC transporter permease PstA n=1 Tax=unclassified Luteococcus TaxID=2639923 RepID=UPI00313C1F61
MSTAVENTQTPSGGGVQLRTPSGKRQMMDKSATAFVWLAGLLAIIPLLWILTTVFVKGITPLVSAQPDYIKTCATKDGSKWIRVEQSQCGDNPAEPLAYRYTESGKYVGVGEKLSGISKSKEPTAVSHTVKIGEPQGAEAGTARNFSLQWWTNDEGQATQNSSVGGAKHAIIGTLEIGLITSLIAVPIAVLGAIWLVEYARGKKAAKVVSFAIDILSGVPSIVAALFVFSLVITIGGMGRSTFAASLALVLLMLPTVLRSTEEMLKLVPDSLREASYALGVPKWKTILKVVIPTCSSGILTGIVLGLARVMGETAPLLILVAFATGTNWSPLASNMGSLPTMINEDRRFATGTTGETRAWGAALTLVLLVMILNLIARAIARMGKLQEK